MSRDVYTVKMISAPLLLIDNTMSVDVLLLKGAHLIVKRKVNRSL